jgi:prepilin-type N-terminal cleavage/methylation domain-containing protein
MSASRPRRARRAGFTLIELLAVIAIIGILAVFLLPQIPKAIDATNVTACKRNLQEIYKALITYRTAHEKLPQRSGAQWLAELVHGDAMENSPASVRKLTCPGVELSALPGLVGKEPTEWFTDIEAVDGGYTAYAARDTKAHPLRRWPTDAKEALVADDNDPDMNHKSATCVLWGDGNASSYELSALKDEGVIGPDDNVLEVGPGSPIEALQKLTLD